MAQYFQVKNFNQGQVIFREGQEGSYACIVHSGEVDVFKDVDGKAVRLARLGRGAVFGEIVGRLGGTVNHQVEAVIPKQVQYRLSIADIEIDGLKALCDRLQSPPIPGGVAFRTEKIGPHVVVNSHDIGRPRVEIGHHLRADQTARPCNQYSHYPSYPNKRNSSAESDCA